MSNTTIEKEGKADLTFLHAIAPVLDRVGGKRRTNLQVALPEIYQSTRVCHSQQHNNR